MKKTIKALKSPVVFLLIFTSFIACDKDFNVIESDVLGKENANFNATNAIYPISAYNKKLDSLQINNLASNLLGVFNDPAYGQTTASIVTQVTPTTFNPDFGTNTVIDSVVINMPYFSTVIGSDDNGNSTYKLDSLYGNATESIKLSIFQNNYFLRDFDPNSTLNSAQNYYSNAENTSNSAITSANVINFDNHIVATIYEDETFTPSADAIVLTTGTGDGKVATRTTPAYRIVLNTPEDILYWTNTIISKQNDPVLSNANNFKNYFRGLYIKAEAITADGSMVFINLASSAANITIHYSKDSTVEGETAQSSYVLSFTGNRINPIINNYNVTLQNGDKVLGDEKLYLKGTSGSMAVVNLFNGLVDCDGDGNVDDQAIDCFKKNFRQTDDNGEFIKDNITRTFLLKRLINEAHLEIYEDEAIDVGTNGIDFHKYDRIYAYDIKNSVPTIDYLIDPTENTASPFNSKVISLSQRDTISAKYKIRLTEHLNNILLRDSTNTKIGLVLSTNVNYTVSSKILQSNDAVTAIPAAALITPRGTILYGSNDNVSEDKRLKLKVFFTEPKED
jgi:hypothetical protein